MLEVSSGPGPVFKYHNKFPLASNADNLPSRVLTNTDLKKK